VGWHAIREINFKIDRSLTVSLNKVNQPVVPGPAIDVLIFANGVDF